MTDTKKYQITTEYGSGFIRQSIKDVDSGEGKAVLYNLCDAQLQHALLALGWKLPKHAPRPERLPRMTKTAKAAKGVVQ